MIMFRLPTTATAPFCPSEVRGSIRVPAAASWWSKLKQFWGPGLLIAIGYMDPGNWATDIQGGSQNVGATQSAHKVELGRLGARSLLAQFLNQSCALSST